MFVEEEQKYQGSEILKKIYREILLVIVFLAFIVYAFSLWTYAGIITKTDARVIIRDFERAYLYQEVLNRESYESQRSKVLSGFFTTKKDMENLLSMAFKSAGDQESKVFTVDVLRGLVAKSKIENLKFEKKVINGAAYIKINVFDEKLIAKYEKALEGYQGKYSKLILDLRGAAYGEIEVASGVADDLLGNGKEICTLDGEVESSVINSDVFCYKFNKIYVLLDKDSGVPSEIIALSLKKGLGDKVTLIGTSTKQTSTAFTDKKYSVHFDTSIASYKWSVGGETSSAVQAYLAPFSLTKLLTLDDYIAQVK